MILCRTHSTGLGAWATAKNRSSACPRDGLKGLRSRAERGASRSVCLRHEGTPRLEAQPFRTAVRWVDIFGLELLVLFFPREKYKEIDCQNVSNPSEIPFGIIID